MVVSFLTFPTFTHTKDSNSHLRSSTNSQELPILIRTFYLSKLGDITNSFNESKTSLEKKNSFIWMFNLPNILLLIEFSVTTGPWRSHGRTFTAWYLRWAWGWAVFVIVKVLEQNSVSLIGNPTLLSPQSECHWYVGFVHLFTI